MACLGLGPFVLNLDSLLNYASVMGLRQDTGIDTSQFAFLGSKWYFGQLQLQC